MKVPFEINGRKFILEPYTTNIEKEILLTSSFEVHDLDNVLELLGAKDYQDLSDDEKKVLLYKYREISLGDEIDIKFVCDECGQGQDGTIPANNFIVPGKRNDKDIKKLSIEFSEDNMELYTSLSQDELDDLDLDEYEALRQRIVDNQSSISFIKQCRCARCGAHKKFDIGSTKYIIEIMSDDSLMTLYKSYNFMVYFGKYSKEDIDSMYPFERSVLIGLLNKTKEDLAK